MSSQTVHLDLAELTADQQVARLKEQHVFLRGKRALLRARVHELPVRQYVSLLERGYRVGLKQEGGSTLTLLPSRGRTHISALASIHDVM